MDECRRGDCLWHRRYGIRVSINCWMQFLPSAIDRYSTAFTDKEHPVLYELYRETHLTQTMPQMVSGHMQGSILQLFIHMAQPQRILEVGTFTDILPLLWL